MFKKNKNINDKENLEEVKEEIEDNNVREIIVERRSGFNFSEVIIIMIIAIMFGFLLGNIVNFVVFSDSSSSGDELDELVSTYDNIVNNYYEDVDKEELIDAGIQGMINYLDDPYATNETSDFEAVTLGDDEYFLLGDNRVISLDSRVIGPVHRKDIEGHTNFVIWPFSKFGTVEKET